MPLPAQAVSSSPRRFSGSVWILLPGILLGLSVPPTGYYPLAWFALVPIVVRWVRSPSYWATFSDAYATFLTMSVVAGYWTLLHQDMPRALIAGGLLLTLPLLLALPFVVGDAVRRRLNVPAGFATLVASSLVVEHVLGQHVVPLPWIQLGHTQLEALVLIQIAELSGVSALSLWLWLVSGAATWMVCAQNFFTPVFTNRTVALLVVGLVFMCPFLYGTYALEYDSADLRSVRVGLVQPALPPQQWLYSDPAERIDHLADLSESLLEERRLNARSASRTAHALDVIVWPELTLPAYSETDRTDRLYERVSAWTRKHRISLLTGAAIQAPGATRYNSALLFDPGQAPQRSDQTSSHPAFDGARFIEPPTTLPPGDPAWRLAQPEYGFEANADKTLLATRHGTLVPLIGFESLYSERTRRHALNGGDLLVVLAQNDWWGRLPSSHLHYAMTRLLAVEHRLPVVVSTVNGTMGMVLPSGRGVERRPDATSTAAYTVRFSAVDSPYLRFGNVVVRLSVFALFGIVVLAAARSTLFPARPRARTSSITDVTDEITDLSPTYRPAGLDWPDAPTAYEDEGPQGRDDYSGTRYARGGYRQPDAPGNLARAARVSDASFAPASAPWSASPSPSSLPPAPPDGATSLAPWASPSRFASPVTPKTSPPVSPRPKP